MGYHCLIKGMALLMGSCVLPGIIITHAPEPITSTPTPPLTVTAAIPRYFPPTYSVDSQGNPQGFAIDVMEAVAKRANLQVTYEIKETWSEAVLALENGEVDLVPNMGITSTSSQMLIYSSPIEIINICVFVLKDNSKIKALNDLSGATIAVVKENEAVNLLEKHKNVNIERLESPEQALFHLLSRKVDGLAYPQPPIWNLAQAISVDYRLKTLKPTLQKVPRAIAVHRDRPELRQRLDHALTDLLPSSDYQQIYRRWYKPTSPIMLSPFTLKLLGLLIVLTVIIIILWRFYLLRSMNRLKQTQIALKKSEAHYRAIVEDQTELICRFLPDGTLTFVNEAYCRYFGQVRKDILYTCFFPFIPQENQSCLRHNLSRLSFHTPVVSHQHPVINGEGEKRWQYWINRGLFDEMGNLVEIQGVGRDITEQKCVEEELADNLQQSQTLNDIIEKIHQSLDLETILQTTTQETQKILKSDRVAVYQFNADWSGQFIAETVGEQWVKLVDDNLQTFWEHSYLQETKGGRYQHQETLAVDDIYNYNVEHEPCHLEFLEQLQAKAYMIVPLFVHNQLWGLFAAYQNSHSRHWQTSELDLLNKIAYQLGLAIKQAELLKELETAKNLAEAASRSKSNFLAHMSHELRTPLNAILGFSQLLNNDQKLAQEQKEYIEIINESGEHLLTLIKSILDMAKIEAGETTLYYQSLNLHKLLRNLSKMFNLKAQSRGIDLIFEIEENIPGSIIIDETKLRQILINLLNNAIKFTEGGQVIVRIKQYSEQKEQEKLNLLFEIEDTGPGIDIEEFPYLFQPFFQTKLGKKSQEGTGLGLAISHEFVNLMGGTLQVSCPLKGGTIFHFILSVDIAKMNSDSPVDNQQKIIGLAPNQPSYRILIIEDNFANRKVLTNLLKPLGFVIKEATNGQEGVKIWETWHPDLIWMDLEMPVMDGYQATQTIRTKMKALDSKTTTKIIALTASVLVENRETVLNIGCDDFVSKPFAESIIFEKLAQHLGVRYRYDSTSISSISPEKTPIIHLNHLKTEIQYLSPAWRDQLYQKAAAADGESILQLVNELSPKYRDLCQGIIQLVENYGFDQIMEISN